MFFAGQEFLEKNDNMLIYYVGNAQNLEFSGHCNY